MEGISFKVVGRKLYIGNEGELYTVELDATSTPSPVDDINGSAIEDGTLPISKFIINTDTPRANIQVIDASLYTTYQEMIDGLYYDGAGDTGSIHLSEAGYNNVALDWIRVN